MSNDTEVQTLTGFLLARVADDEAAARTSADSLGGRWAVAAPTSHYQAVWSVRGGMVARSALGDPFPAHIARHDPVRVLAECASKRAIVERYEFVAAAGGETSELAFHEQGLFEAVMSLARVYADHPDFRDEWRVES